MMFLNPAVLLGLLAASIPVLIHLFNLRKLQRIEFSTLSFLKELQKNKIRKIKLKQWLLLLLRVLIITFIVLSFARPALKGIAIGGATSAAKTSAVFIIDDTFSMSVVDTKGSYFNQAKAAIKDLLSNFQEGDDAALIKISSAGKDEIMLSSNLVDFRKNIESLKLSDETGKINDALVKAAGVLSASNNFNKEIYLLTDFQKGKIAGDEELSNLSRELNNRVKLYS
ncbi:MAG: BatA domain-containing protein, partial [Ignavibacteriaceae bacterium]|nr:BatA domain-containing protein [Ignavibacteriaceae bacterium]